MSWMPSHDPALGDAHACDALELVVVPRVRDLGGFAVRRALPQLKRQMVGPFIFFDQMGPVQFLAGQGMDVRPHPHIGLATVTYLFDGRIMHRDSEGNALEITPGAMNLMTAGSGIAHSERTPSDARVTGIGMSGIQSWVALPVAQEETAPSFQHFSAASLPVVTDRGVWARVIAGSAFGPPPRSHPVRLALCRGEAGRRRQRAARSRPGGARDLRGRRRDPHRRRHVRGAAPADFPPRRPHHRDRDARCEADVPGRRGAGRAALHLVEFRVLAFDRIEAAKADWKSGRFKPVPGETEFIPLPER